MERCQACRACDLAESRTQVVVYRGAVPAAILILGEAPGAEEDRLGEPFVGRSGRLLQSYFDELGLPPEAYHIANILKCRPPENRTPTKEEAAACRPLLEEHLRLVQPRTIVCCGATAYQRLTGDKTPISKIRGQILEWQGYRVMPTFHPSYILRSGGKRPELKADLAALWALLQGEEGQR